MDDYVTIDYSRLCALDRVGVFGLAGCWFSQCHAAFRCWR